MSVENTSQALGAAEALTEKLNEAQGLVTQIVEFLEQVEENAERTETVVPVGVSSAHQGCDEMTEALGSLLNETEGLTNALAAISQ